MQVIKFNGVRIKNIQHLAHLIDSKLFLYPSIMRSFSFAMCFMVVPLICSFSACMDKYLCFEFEDCYAAVLEREAVIATSSSLLEDYGIQSERSSDLLKPYVDSLEVEGDQQADQEFGDSPVSNIEVGHDGLFWT
jgi:hypothetical protein